MKPSFLTGSLSSTAASPYTISQTSITGKTAHNKCHVSQLAILSPALPIREMSPTSNQSAGLQTREEPAFARALPINSPLSIIQSNASHGVPNFNHVSNKAAHHNTNVAEHRSDIENPNDDDDDDDDEERLQRGRERNREHARRTRLRKKAQLQELQQKYREMMSERQTLNQQLQDRRIASILLGLSTSTAAPTECGDVSSSNVVASNHVVSHTMSDNSDHCSTSVTAPTSSPFQIAKTPRRKRGFSDVQLPTNMTPIAISGTSNEVSSVSSTKSHINWKTGMYSDETGRQRQMSSKQLEALRRERNRMHAKMTRDRKKCFMSTMVKAIEELGQELASLRQSLQQEQGEATPMTAMSSSASSIQESSNMITPELTSRPSPPYTSSSIQTVSSFISSQSSSPNPEEPSPQSNIHEPEKRVCHGFLVNK